MSKKSPTASAAEKLIDQARALPDAERRAFLEDGVGNDKEPLSTLNLQIEQDDSFLVRGGALRGGALSEDLADTLEGTDQLRELGPYRLLDRLGRGGMGVVWHARALPPDNFRVGAVQSNLGANLLERGRISEARLHLEQGHAILLAALGADHPGTEKAAQRLEQLEQETRTRSSVATR